MQVHSEKKLTDNFRSHLPGFWALVFTQAQGAFSDNLYRWIIVYWMLAQVADGSSDTNTIALGVIVFSIAYLVCPGIAGALSDKFSKRKVIITTKITEMAIMSFSFVAFQVDTAWLFWTVWFFMSLQSAFFGPAKLGILPEIFPETRLSWANGIMQLTLFVAMISGTLLAGWLVYEEYAPTTMTTILVACSAVGFFTSLFIPKVPAAAPQRAIPMNPWGGVGKHLEEFASNRVLMLTLVGGTFFWFIGALAQQNAVWYSETYFDGNQWWSSAFQAAMMIGIGLGSFSAGYLSRRKIELGLSPIGVVGMAVMALFLAFEWESQQTFLLMLAGFSFFGGLYEVPIDATLEHRSPRGSRGGLIATWNIATCIGILVAGGLFMGLGALDIGPRQVFLATSVCALLMLVYMVVRHPIYVLRSGLWLLTSSIYRLRVIGRRNIPERGPALLVANHSSFFDALVLLASIDREVRFVISQEIYEVPWIRFLARFTGAIPVSAVGGPSKLAQSFHRATEALKNGEVVCIFAEGQVTRTGHILPFRKSLERITKGIDVPLVPVHIDRL